MNFRNLKYLIALATGSIVLNSCVVYNPDHMASLPVSDIVQMSKDGVSSRDIIDQIRGSHSVYTLRADQLAKLSKEGVQDSVINYMEKTHMDAVRRNQVMNDSYYGYNGFYGYPYLGLGFGWPYGYFGWGYSPTIVIHSGGGFSGGFHGGGFRR